MNAAAQKWEEFKVDAEVKGPIFLKQSTYEYKGKAKNTAIIGTKKIYKSEWSKGFDRVDVDINNYIEFNNSLTAE